MNNSDKPQTNMEWIDSKAQTPDAGQNVLIWHVDFGVGIGYYTHFDNCFAGTFHGVPVICESKSQIHWMPLPEPPTK